MAVNKVIFGGTTLIDITDTTAADTDVANSKDFYSAAGVKTSGSVSAPSYQAKTATPTRSSQTIAPDSGYDALSSVTVGAIPSNYIVPSGSQTLTENDTYDVTSLASITVDVQSSGGLNWQIDNRNGRIAATTYTDTGLSITVAKTGTYNVYWSGFRNTTSGTSGSQLYVNGSARGSAQTTFSNSYIQTPKLTGISLSAGDVVTIRARSRASNYYMCVGNLVIEQTS